MYALSSTEFCFSCTAGNSHSLFFHLKLNQQYIFAAPVAGGGTLRTLQQATINITRTSPCTTNQLRVCPTNCSRHAAFTFFILNHAWMDCFEKTSIVGLIMRCNDNFPLDGRCMTLRLMLQIKLTHAMCAFLCDPPFLI